MGGAARPPKSCTHTGPSPRWPLEGSTFPAKAAGSPELEGSLGWSFLFPQMAAAPKSFQKILALVTGTRTGCALEEPSLFLKDGKFLKGSNAHLELPAAGSATETSGPAVGPPGSCPPGCPSWRRKWPGDFVPSTETVFLAIKNFTPRHPQAPRRKRFFRKQSRPQKFGLKCVTLKLSPAAPPPPHPGWCLGGFETISAMMFVKGKWSL